MINDLQIQQICDPVAAADDTDQNSDILDMQNWEGAIFIVPVTDSVATGVAKLTIEQNEEESDSGMDALTVAAASATCVEGDDLNNKLLIVDVYKPLKRYLQGVLTSETANIAFGTMIAIQYRGRKFPVEKAESVLESVFAVSPDES